LPNKKSYLTPPQAESVGQSRPNDLWTEINTQWGGMGERIQWLNGVGPLGGQKNSGEVVDGDAPGQSCLSGKKNGLRLTPVASQV